MPLSSCVAASLACFVHTCKHMAARAMWKAVVRVGGQSGGLPVKLYAAVEGKRLGFHLLHGEDGARVEQRIVNPETGDAVPPSEIHKGYEVRSGVFVLVSPEELQSAAPEPSRDVDVQTFIPTGAIAPAWFERPYYLGPDGDAEHYFALAEALASTKHVGLAHWVMRGKRYSGVLCAHGPHLGLLTLRHRDEVVATPKLRMPKSRAPDPKELALAEQLVASLEGTFDPRELHSDYEERVLAMIERKARGETVKHEPAPQRAALEPSLVAALEASVAKISPARGAAARPGIAKAKRRGEESRKSA